jgi:hypothetical protein
VGTIGSQIVVEWPHIGRLLVSGSGASARFEPLAGVDPAVLDKFRATSLVACRRYLAGDLSLHGSAVRLSSCAVVFVGEKGAGKSTTAMALVERSGGEFLADDIVPIDWIGDTPVVLPMDESLWLSAEVSAWFGLDANYAGKMPHPPRARATTSEHLGAIVELVFDDSIDGVDLRPLRGQDAFLVLSKAQVCYPTGGDAEALRDLESRARLGGAARVFRLRRARKFDTLAAMAAAVSRRFDAPTADEGP